MGYNLPINGGILTSWDIQVGPHFPIPGVGRKKTYLVVPDPDKRTSCPLEKLEADLESTILTRFFFGFGLFSGAFAVGVWGKVITPRKLTNGYPK